MSYSQEASSIRDVNQDHIPEKSHHEIDLIDIAAMLWRARVLILGCIMIGVICVGILSIAAHKLHAYPLTNNDIWTVQVGSKVADESVILRTSVILNNYLKTPAGSKVFYEAIAEPSHLSKIAVVAWSKKQERGQGALSRIEQTESSLEIDFLDPIGDLSASDVKHILLPALNKVITQYNKIYADVQSQLDIDKVNVRLKSDQLKMQALRHYDKYARLTPTTQRVVLESVLNQLYDREKTDDAMVFLLASTPDSEAPKTELLADYRKFRLAWESLDARSKALSKSLGVDYLSPIDTFDRIEYVSKNSVSSANFRDNAVVKIGLLLVAGGAVGGVLGTLASLLRVFFKNNRARFRLLFNDKRF